MIMEILFDKAHPKSLVEALNLIEGLHVGEKYSVAFYDSTVNDATLQQPVLFRIDRQKKGIEPVTELLYESGFRVIALKLPQDKKMTLYDLSLAIISLWPKAISLIKEKGKPFICKSNNKLDKLFIVKEQ